MTRKFVELTWTNPKPSRRQPNDALTLLIAIDQIACVKRFDNGSVMITMTTGDLMGCDLSYAELADLLQGSQN